MVLDAPSTTAIYFSSSSFMNSCSSMATLGMANPKKDEILM